MLLMLARWVLNGPMQAVAAAALMAVVPGFGWVSGAVVALVALRKSLADAALPLLVACLIAVVMHWPAGDITQLGLVLAATAGSLVLANTRSLDWAVVAAGMVSALYIAAAVNWAPEKIEQLVTLYQPMFDVWIGEMAKSGSDVALDALDIRRIVVEGMALMTAFAALAALLLARWLQGRLFNPGGFQVEFHQLRLPSVATIVLAVLLAAIQASPEARVLLPGVLAAFLLAGLALVHGVLGRKPNNGPLLVVFYLGLVLSAGFGVMILILVAAVDSFLDFRKRIRKEV